MPAVYRKIQILPNGEIAEVTTGKSLICALRGTLCNAKTCTAYSMEEYEGRRRAHCSLPGSVAHNQLGEVEDGEIVALRKAE